MGVIRFETQGVRWTLWLIAFAVPLATVLSGDMGLRAQELASAQGDWDSAMEAMEKSDWDRAIQELDVIAQQRPDEARVYYWRGRVRFLKGDAYGAVEDFDRFHQESPEARSRQWERGIALFYVGRYEDGAAQFVDYQNYHDADVENAVWRYLCEVPTLGVEKARERVLEIGPDPRVPMRRIHALYRGMATPDEVFADVERVAGNPAAEKAARFYAHLYVGLWLESVGRNEEALPHLEAAAQQYRIDHYMGDVAKWHRAMVQEREKRRTAAGGDDRKER